MGLTLVTGHRCAPLRTERDVAESLAGHTVTLDELYQACREAGVCERDDGDTVIHGRSDARWKRRARNALQALKRAGRAKPVGDGQWVLSGTRERPRWMVLALDRYGALSAVSALGLEEACTLLDELGEPVDLVLTDPPYGLARDADGDLRSYARDETAVLGGYRDVSPAAFPAFMAAWIAKAAHALRPGGQLVVVTATEQAWTVGAAAHAAELRFVSQIAAWKVFPLRLTRRPAFAHWVCSVYTRGPLEHPHRFFACPPELPRARSGRVYPQDVWRLTRYARPGLLRYDNALPPQLVSLLMRSFSRGPENGHDAYADLVVDPFVGSGTTALVAHELQRRFVGGDLNPAALRFTLARMCEEDSQLGWRPAR